MTLRKPADLSTFRIGGDLPVTRYGLGTIQFTGDPDRWGPPADPDHAKAVLRAAVEAGITHIDTADCYGPRHCETLIAEALHPYRDEIVIATKGGIRRTRPDEWDHYGHPDYLRSCIDQSLRRLRRDTLDLYYLHRIDPRIPLADQLGALVTARQSGKIRHIGLSKVTLDELEQAQKITPVAAVQNPHNPASADHRLREHCHKHNLAYVPYRPFAGTADHLAAPAEHLQQRIDHAMRSHLTDAPTTLLIPGTRSIDHLTANLAAFRHITATTSDPSASAARRQPR
ncbi:aldo/keto reductase [Amycolatopsis sp. WGS_07]|uniref:aldo/keto reductase n=1 Tax=Amycolatopsis sp. WGS_07 TaxID=3076764 RepID=UPI0038737791